MDSLSLSLMSGTGVRAITFTLILLLIGGSAEWLYWTYAYSPLRALPAAVIRSAREALGLGLRRLALLIGGVLFFTGATIASSAELSWPDGMHETVVSVTVWLMMVRLAWAVFLAAAGGCLRVPGQAGTGVGGTATHFPSLVPAGRFGGAHLCGVAAGSAGCIHHCDSAGGSGGAADGAAGGGVSFLVRALESGADDSFFRRDSR